MGSQSLLSYQIDFPAEALVPLLPETSQKNIRTFSGLCFLLAIGCIATILGLEVNVKAYEEHDMKTNNLCDLERLLTKATELLIDSEVELAIVEALLQQRAIVLDHLWNEACLRRDERVVVDGLIEEIRPKAR